MGSEPEVIAFTGVVSKTEEEYGMIREDVFFVKSVVKGPFPKLGDLVLVQAEEVKGMPFKYVAKRVQGLYKKENLEVADTEIRPKLENCSNTSKDTQENLPNENEDNFLLLTTPANANTDEYSLPEEKYNTDIKTDCNNSEMALNSGEVVQNSYQTVHADTSDSNRENFETNCGPQLQERQAEITTQDSKVEELPKKAEEGEQVHNDDLIDQSDNVSSDSLKQQPEESKPPKNKCIKELNKRPADFSKRLREKLAKLYCNAEGQEQCFTCRSTEHRVKNCPIRQEKINKTKQQTLETIKKEILDEPAVDMAISGDQPNAKVEMETVGKVDTTSLLPNVVKDSVDMEECEDLFMRENENAQIIKPELSDRTNDNPNEKEKPKDFIKIRGERKVHPPPPPKSQSSDPSAGSSSKSLNFESTITIKTNLLSFNENPTSNKKKEESDSERMGKKSGCNSSISKNSSMNPVKKEIICYKCKKAGHKAKDCDLPQIELKIGIRFCDICRRTNHMTDKCKFRKNPEFKNSKEPLFCQNCRKVNHSTENCRFLKNPAFEYVEEVIFCINCQTASHNTENCRFIRNPEFRNVEEIIFCLNCQTATHNTENCKFLNNATFKKTEVDIFCDHCRKNTHETKNCRFLKKRSFETQDCRTVNNRAAENRDENFCQHCQKFNHRTENCRFLKNRAAKKLENIIFCENCKITNHKTENCWFINNQEAKNLFCDHCQTNNHRTEYCRFLKSSGKELPNYNGQKSKDSSRSRRTNSSESDSQRNPCKGCLIIEQGGNSRNHRKDCLFWEDAHFNHKRKRGENDQDQFSYNNQDNYENMNGYYDQPMQEELQMIDNNQDGCNYNFNFQGPPMEHHPMNQNPNHDNFGYEDNFQGPPSIGQLPVFDPRSNKWSDESANDGRFESGRRSPVRLVARHKEDIQSAVRENRKRLPPRDREQNFSNAFENAGNMNDFYQEQNFPDTFGPPQNNFSGQQFPETFGNANCQGTEEPPFCYHCNKLGHVDKYCWFLHPSLKRQKI